MSWHSAQFPLAKFRPASISPNPAGCAVDATNSRPCISTAAASPAFNGLPWSDSETYTSLNPVKASRRPRPSNEDAVCEDLSSAHHLTAPHRFQFDPCYGASAVDQLLSMCEAVQVATANSASQGFDQNLARRAGARDRNFSHVQRTMLHDDGVHRHRRVLAREVDALLFPSYRRRHSPTWPLAQHSCQLTTCLRIYPPDLRNFREVRCRQAPRHSLSLEVRGRGRRIPISQYA